MTPVSIVKIVASASVLVAVSSAALVFGIKHVQRVKRRVLRSRSTGRGLSRGLKWVPRPQR